MLDIIIPAYKARDTLPQALDSLVTQTKKMFIVTIVQDCDDEDYTDIVEEYTRRGLNIKLITTPENIGPGLARQFGMDQEKMCDYCIFVDADDLLNPRAVEILYTEAKKQNADIVLSDFYAERHGEPGSYLSCKTTPVTWCFPAGTLILTEKGYRSIEELRIGDLVYTKDGSLQPIEAVMSHKANNMVSTQVSGALSLKCTDNHKFYTYNTDYNLECIPIKDVQHSTKLALFRLSNRTNNIDQNLAYIIGRYVGDGWKTSKKVKLQSGLKEYWSYFLCSSFQEKEELIDKLNKANISFGLHNNDHVQEFTLHKCNKELIYYLDDCGRYATSKHFPSEFLTWDDATLRALLQGYFDADGCAIKDRKDGSINKIITVSRQLALEVSLILRTLGYNPTYGVQDLDNTTQVIMGKVCNRHTEYTVYWRENNDKSKYVSNQSWGCSTYGIKLNKEPDEIVYNLTVSGNHSYIAGDFIVSNCHGKCYKLQYLREKNIRFLPELRLNEDSYFNLVAVSCAERKFYVNECTYIWRANPSSLTRKAGELNFFLKSWEQYVASQVYAIENISKISGSMKVESLALALNNIYSHCMKALYCNLDIDLPIIHQLTNSITVKNGINNEKFWKVIDQNLKASCMFNKQLIFYRMRFCDWLRKYVLGENK